MSFQFSINRPKAAQTCVNNTQQRGKVNAGFPPPSHRKSNEKQHPTFPIFSSALQVWFPGRLMHRDTQRARRALVSELIISLQMPWMRRSAHEKQVLLCLWGSI